MSWPVQDNDLFHLREGVPSSKGSALRQTTRHLHFIHVFLIAISVVMDAADPVLFFGVYRR